MKIMLTQGEKLRIGFYDGGIGMEMEGEFEVHFGTSKYPTKLMILETGRSVRGEIIWEQDCAD